jgi:hypothetical protein
MHKKLKRMSQFHAKHGITVGAPRYAEQMRTCYLILERLMKENYTTPYDERNKPHFEWFSKKFDRSMERKANENGCVTIIRRNEPDEPEARWIIPANEHEAKLIQQDIDLFCKIFSRHVQEWWD